MRGDGTLYRRGRIWWLTYYHTPASTKGPPTMDGSSPTDTEWLADMERLVAIAKRCHAIASDPTTLPNTRKRAIKLCAEIKAIAGQLEGQPQE